METNNKLIAEFIGYIKYSELHQGLYCEETCELGEFENLKSYSWEWLMKAVGKIEDMGCEVVITNCECTISCPNDYFYITTGKKRKDAVYDAVVEFIIDHKKKIKMRKLKIKSADFINWFFKSGADQDQKTGATDLGNYVIEQLLEGSLTITPQDILNRCEVTVIPIHLVEGFEGTDSTMEIEDGISCGKISSDFKIKLV